MYNVYSIETERLYVYVQYTHNTDIKRARENVEGSSAHTTAALFIISCKIQNNVQ